MKVFLVVLLVPLLFFSCEKKEKSFEPYCKLTEAEMINVMVDFSLVKSMKSLARKDLKDSGIKPYEYLFTKHGVDSIVIRENLKYYNLDYEKAKKLFDTVSVVINTRSEKLQLIIDEMEKDSEEGEDKSDEDDNEEEVEEELEDDENKKVEKDSIITDNKNFKKSKWKKRLIDAKKKQD